MEKEQETTQAVRRHVPGAEEQEFIKRLEKIYLNKAIKTKYGWYVVKQIYGACTCIDDDQPSFWTVGDFIWTQELNPEEILKYRVRIDQYSGFYIDENDNLTEEDHYIDESFDDIKDEIYDYALQVNDQNMVAMDEHDMVVCIDDNKLKKCEVKYFNSDTFIYTLYCYHTGETLYRRGPEVLHVEYYGC